MSPLFLSDNEPLGGSSVVVEIPLDQDSEIEDTGNAERQHLREETAEITVDTTEEKRLQREAEQRAAEQRGLRREAAAAEQKRLQREAEQKAAADAAEQERSQQEAEAVEQANLRRETEERAAADAAEQERLQREMEERAAVVAEQERLQREEEERVAVAAEQERLRREAEERAASEAAERERLEQEAMAAEQVRLQIDAEERAAEQERLRREAEARAAAEAAKQEQRQLEEDERVAQERATTLAQLEQDGQNVPLPPDADPSGGSRPVTQLDLPSLITRLREESNQLDNDSTIISEASEIPAPTSRDDHSQTKAQTVEVPTTDESVPRAETVGLEPITEERSSIQLVAVDEGRQRQ